LRNKIITLISLGLLGILIFFGSKEFSFRKANSLLAAVTTPYPTIPISENSEIEKTAVTPKASRNIELLSPLAGDRINSGFLVKGNARTKDNTVVIRLYDSYGNIITETTTLSNPPFSGDFGPFEKVITFSSDDSSGNLEVFQYNNVTDSINDTVNIPLKFN
jgi:hypothetical protein